MKVIAVLRKSNSLVYIRVTFGRDKDVKVSTSMHIDPIYWDSKIPGITRTRRKCLRRCVRSSTTR